MQKRETGEKPLWYIKHGNATNTLPWLLHESFNNCNVTSNLSPNLSAESAEGEVAIKVPLGTILRFEKIARFVHCKRLGSRDL